MTLDQSLYFISGIDTNVGKTFATGFLAAQIARQGRRVITQKLIQTGCHGISEDILMHRKIQQIPLSTFDQDGTTCPYVLSYPCSPHMASVLDGVEYDFARVQASTERLIKHFDVVLLEGAGGLMVPLNDKMLTIDYVVQRNMPLILVTSGKLGSINHTLLSLEVCKQRGIEIAALVYNRYPTVDQKIEENTKQYLINYLNAKFSSTQWIELPEFDYFCAD